MTHPETSISPAELSAFPLPLPLPLPPPQAPALSPAVRERLAHLFRATLAHGRIHPLYLPVLRFRQARETE